MISFLFISRGNEGSPLAQHLARRNIVKMFSANDRIPKIIDKVKYLSSWKDAVESTDVIIITDPLSVDEGVLKEISGSCLVLNGDYIINRLVKNDDFITLCNQAIGDNSILIDGLKCKITGIFNGEFLPCFQLVVEDNKFMEKGKGQNVYMGAVSYFFDKCDLFDKTFIKLVPILKELKFVGIITLEIIVDEAGVRIIGVDNKLDANNYNLFESIDMPTELFIYKLLNKESIDELAYKNVAMNIGLSVSPYPYDFMYDPINKGDCYHMNDGALAHFWKELSLKALIGYVTAWGASYEQAKGRCYRTINRICTSDDVQYRSDIGFKANKIKQQLQSQGWLNDNTIST